MRRISQLINDIRFNTNNTDTNRYSDLSLVKFFNDAQDAIQAIIFMTDTDGKYFVKESFVKMVYAQELYDLPSDIYSLNSVNGMARSVSEGSENYWTPLRKLSEKERRKGFGYILQGKQFIISPLPRINLDVGVRVNYVKKLPRLSPRIGTVKKFTTGVSLTLKNPIDGDISNYSDYVCIIDKFGVSKLDSIFIDSYDEATGKIKTSADLSTIAIDDYVVIGQVATSHSELADNVEALLTSFVERRIQLVDSSSDLSNIDIFTQEEKDLITELYKKSDHDTKYPAIVDDTYISE